MTDDFTLDLFLPRVGEVFHVSAEGRQVPILLSEVSRLPTEGSTRRKREPFALVFHAARGSGLNEQLYRLETPGLDPFDCFLVRLAPDGVGERYEAIYS